jgi:molecular chaperone GrpE
MDHDHDANDVTAAATEEPLPEGAAPGSSMTTGDPASVPDGAAGVALAPPDPHAESRARIETLERERNDLKDRMLRLAADFDNFKKRSRKDLSEAQDRGREALLREILPVIDNLERALAHAEEKNGVDPAGFVEGIRLVHRQLVTALEKFEVRPFSAMGEAFDPQFHAAVQQVETAAHPAGQVVSEFMKGYRIGQRLLRPAMVGVARAPQPGPQAPLPGERTGGDGQDGVSS